MRQWELTCTQQTAAGGSSPRKLERVPRALAFWVSWFRPVRQEASATEELACHLPTTTAYFTALFHGASQHVPPEENAPSAGEPSKDGDNATTHDDDPKPWQLKHERALALRTNGDLQEATDLLREVAQDVKHSLGLENIETLTAIQNLAVVRLDLGDTDVAATLFQSVLSTAGRVFGEEHAFTTRSMANLASAGKIPGSRGLAAGRILKKTQKAVRETYSNVPPDTHPDILAAKASLANALQYKGESAESGRLFEDVYNTTAKAFGADAPETIGAINDYANWLQDQDRVDEAEPLFEEVLKWNQTRSGERHFCTAMPRHNLAAAYRSEGRLEDAEVLLRQSYDILNQSEGSHGLEKVVVGNHLTTAIFHLSLDKRDQKRLGKPSVCTRLWWRRLV
ncbi:kinesin light chain 2 [Colletotrichum liriopes]|uniref:Kinesin light chain 2 n=1 Tax=Colletotrichum liriopes TaxID=708192 RepID=A0AA37GY88_9PEZI|nr:kinesin light chain 2 [Colletotrichum liriopes]